MCITFRKYNEMFMSNLSGRAFTIINAHTDDSHLCFISNMSTKTQQSQFSGKGGTKFTTLLKGNLKASRNQEIPQIFLILIQGQERKYLDQ